MAEGALVRLENTFPNIGSAELIEVIASQFEVLSSGSEAIDWLADVWSLEDIATVYGLRISVGRKGVNVKFDSIENPFFRRIAKEYMRDRLLTKTLSIGTVSGYVGALKAFFNVVSERHPEWCDLRDLDRPDIEAYYRELDSRKLTERSFGTALGHVRTALADMQVLEESYAPKKSVFALIRDEDYRKIPPNNSLDYVPQIVIRQIFANFDKLDEQLQLAFLVGMKTGLRYCDVFALKPADIVEVSGVTYIRHDIQKSEIKDHLVPVDDNLSFLLHAQIERKSLDPVGRECEYLFYERQGKKAGKHIQNCDVNKALRKFIIKNDIRDESGELFHFHFHQLRHTFGIEMRREGVDLRTIQEMLGHSSVGTTLKYAKALGEDKREAFELARQKGSFDVFKPAIKYTAADSGLSGAEVQRVISSSEIDLVEVSFGLCIAPSNERCWYSTQPSCIDAERGPCRDLLVGALASDVEKYEIQIRAAEKIARVSRSCGRDDLAKIADTKIAMLRTVLSVISEGRIVSGDVERLAKRLTEGVKHERSR